MNDTYYTYSNVVNSGVAALNLTKFPHKVEKLLPINVLKPEWRYSNLSPNAMVPLEGGSANCGQVAVKIARSTLIMSGYWTKIPNLVQISPREGLVGKWAKTDEHDIGIQ